jgi:hypothetical protein
MNLTSKENKNMNTFENYEEKIKNIENLIKKIHDNSFLFEPSYNENNILFFSFNKK